MLIAQLINIYVFLLIARILLSWFPISSGGVMEQVYNGLYSITEPILGPVRRALPPMGGFDLSPMLVILGLRLLSSAL